MAISQNRVRKSKLRKEEMWEKESSRKFKRARRRKETKWIIFQAP